MFLFTVKKIVSFFLLPLEISMILLVTATILILFHKRKRISHILLCCGIGLLFLSSNPSVAYALMSALENSFPRYESQYGDVQYVVVLGGGHISDQRMPITSMLNPSALRRCMEGVRIMRLHSGSKIILSGYGGPDSIPHAVMLSRFVKSIGVPDSLIIVEPRTKDTHEEALIIKTIVQDKPFVLVTTASHMPRAYRLFCGQGVKPYPAPTDFFASKPSSFSLISNPDALRNTHIAIHEYVGYVWAFMAGQMRE